jgi:hypothetical protein
MWSPELDEVAEYREQDYLYAVAEIRTLVDRVNNGDVSLSLNEGFSIPRDYSVVDLWRNDDGYHAMFPKRSGPTRIHWGRMGKNG